VSSRFRSELIKLGVFVVVAVLITVSVVATLLDLKLGQPSTGYHAIFANASGLQSGDTVRIAGVEVGKVNGVGLVGDKAEVDFTVASSNHLTTNSTASIQFENLLGQRYLQINAGAPGGAPLRSGATIPMSRTQPGLDLTTVFSGFQPLLAALNPQQINDLTGSIIAVLQGESGAVANLVNQTAQLTGNLASRQTVIYKILDNLTPLLTAVNAHDQQLGQLIDGLNSLVTGLAGQRQQIGDAVTGLSNLTVNATNLLQNVQPTLDQDLGGLQGVTSELLANQTQLSSVIADLPALLNSLDKVTSSGNYLAVYICDLTLNVSGPISVKLSPTVPQSPPLSVPTGIIGDQTQKTSVCS
jgi:phospholipid/cholesterol/gamma-HCH transport system substrate-binding protein